MIKNGGLGRRIRVMQNEAISSRKTKKKEILYMGGEKKGERGRDKERERLCLS